MKDRIERIKERLSKPYTKHSADIIFDYIKNAEISFSGEGKADLIYSGLMPYPFENSQNSTLLSITPVLLKTKKIKEKQPKKMLNEILKGSEQTIFIDLDKKIFTRGSSDGSGTRGIYDDLALIFKDAKSPTLIPILSKDVLLECYLFKRFIGFYCYHNQRYKFKKGEDYPKISYIEKRLFNNNVKIILEPEHEIIELVKFYNPESNKK